MSLSRSGNAVILIAIIAVVIGAAFIGYSSVKSSESAEQELTKSEAPEQAETTNGAEHAHTHAHDGEAAVANQPADLAGLAPHAMDIVIGNPNAPIRIVEYASLSCPHCARMHMEILPEIKEEFVKTGQAYIAYRHFPLNAPALKASVAVSCAPESARAAMLDTLFGDQKTWAFDSGYAEKIATIATNYGVTAEALEACNNDVELENNLLQSRQVGEMAGVQSTPTLFVNDAILEGAVDAETIRLAIAEAQNPTMSEEESPASKALEDTVDAAVDAADALMDGDNAKEIPQE